VLGLGVGGAEAFEVGVGDIVEDDAAAQGKEIAFALAQRGLDVLAVGHEFVAGAVEAVLGAFGDADVEEFGQGGAVGPIDQGPFAEGFDEAVGNHELGGGNGAGVHAKGLEHGSELELVPGLERDEFGTEFDDIGRFDGVEKDAVEGGLGDRCGGLGAVGEANDAIDPVAGFRGEGGVEKVALAMDAAFDGEGDERFFSLRDGGIAQGGDDLLAGQAFAIAIGMNELNKAGALDRFCSKIHAGKKIGEKKWRVKRSVI
jgi:hypothetical protein